MALPADFIYLDRDVASGDVTVRRTPAVDLVDSETLRQDGISTTSRRPCIVRFRGDIYVVGCFTRPIYYPVRDAAFWPVGITPPSRTLSVSVGSGSGGGQGVALCYITFQHRNGDVVLAESNPSNVVQLELDGQGRVWTGLTDTTRERRVTHVAGYVSMNGSNYRRAFVTAYGVTSYEENVPTAGLTLQGPDGNYLPPNGVAYATEFAGRMWYANTSEHPYRTWFSDAGEPQYVGLASFRDTLDRDPIVGFRKLQNILVIFTRTCAYGIRGYGDSSFVIEKLDSSVGLLSHFGILEIHNKLWFPSHDGYFIFDGAGFYFAMKDIRPYWLADRSANEDAFARGFAIDDRIGKNMIFLTNRPLRPDFEGEAAGTVAYVANYLNFERTMGGGQEQPDWSIDVRGRFDYSAFYGLDNVLYYGGEDGEIRAEDPDDPDDDGDTLAKPLLIEGGHLLFQEPGEDVESGKQIEDLWVYMESETTAWACYVLMGDEWAARRIQPENVLSHWKIDVAASALTQVVGASIVSYIPETTHYLGAPEGVTGRGLTMRFRSTSPVGLKFRGYGGAWAPGAAPRHEQQITTMSVELDGAPITENEDDSPYTVSSAIDITLEALIAGGAVTGTVDWVWTGDNTGSEQDILSDATGVSRAFNFGVAALVEMVVTLTVNGASISQTFYFTSTP